MSDSMISCPRCGNSMPAGGRFCINCGFILESPPEQATSEDDTSMQEATEPGMPGEGIAMSEDVSQADEGLATLSGAIGSAPGESMTDASSTPDPNSSAESGTELDAAPDSPAHPESWYAELSASPGGEVSSPQDSAVEMGTTSDESLTQPELEDQPTDGAPPEPFAASASSATPSVPVPGPEETTIYTPPSPSTGWQPGAYDMGGTEPSDISMADQVPTAPSYEAAPGQTQSIFSPPPPPLPQDQGQYTQPISPQQGYSPPSQPPQASQQGYTPPPAYSGQSLPTPGTQPLQPGQPYPNYPQYQQGYPPQQVAAPKDPTTALMLELLGFLGFLGIGHIYAGKTNRGIALLIGWLVYLTASFVLTICLVGCFMFIAWLIVPPLSGIWVKNEMEKERLSGFRP